MARSALQQRAEPWINGAATPTLTRNTERRPGPGVCRGVTAFADAQQLHPTAGPRLARYQAEVGGELAR